MKEIILKAAAVFVLSFVAVVSLFHLDSVCCETTGEGGKLVLAVDNLEFFH